jgi:hypoxanthine phosphoribosyltransferase
MKYEWLSWEKFEHLAQKLAQVISPLVKRGEINRLYGIPRGGLVPAVRLSYILNIPIVEFSQISETTLVVDDVLGSGRTARNLLRKVPSRYFSTLLYAESSIPPGLTMFCGGEKIPEGIFVKMPWALEDDLH